MATFSYTVQEGTTEGAYTITWYKGEGEAKEELCSGAVMLKGTVVGVEAAIAFAADDIRKAHPDLFMEDAPEDPMMMEMMEGGDN